VYTFTHAISGPRTSSMAQQWKAEWVFQNNEKLSHHLLPLHISRFFHIIFKLETTGLFLKRCCKIDWIFSILFVCVIKYDGTYTPSFVLIQIIGI